MKALIAGLYKPNGTRPIGGVQSWSLTVGQCLTKLGFEVTHWEYGDKDPEGRFDLGILHHWHRTKHLAEKCSKFVNVSHGIIPEEKPGVRMPIYTSEEVQTHWGGGGWVLRQPIDTEFWRPGLQERRYLTFFSYRNGFPFAQKLAKSKGLEYMHLRGKTPIECRDILQQSEYVIASGRALLEAMSCGAKCILADNRKYMGPKFHENIITSRKLNYSGRGGVTPTYENLSEALASAEDMRWYVLSIHNYKDIARRLMIMAGMAQ